MSVEAWRYLTWAIVVVLGGALAVLDRRAIRGWYLGSLLLVALGAGVIVTSASPFSFGATNYYMEGIILSGGAALALAGYVVVLVASLLIRAIGKLRK